MAILAHLTLIRFCFFFPKALASFQDLPYHHHSYVVAEVASAMTGKAGPVAWTSLWSERAGVLRVQRDLRFVTMGSNSLPKSPGPHSPCPP